MSIGTSVPLPAYTIDPAFMAKKAEELGFESIWYAEHPAVPVHSASPFPATGGDIPWTYSHFTDPYIALARASGVTRTIKLGTGITLVPERNPLLLAKEIASLDLFSGGRFLFGIGTGWLREETELMGGDFEHRWTQTREAIEVMKALWTHDEAEYHGRYFNFPPGPLLSQTGPEAASADYPWGTRQECVAPGGGPCRWLVAQPHHAGGGRDQPRPARRHGKGGGAGPEVD